MAISRTIKKLLTQTFASLFFLIFTATAYALPPAPVPQTGQTKCYDSSGAIIPCAGTGQDADIKAGVGWPNARFTVNDNSTVNDNLTGLMWTKDANAPGPAACGPATSKTWQGALTYAACLNANSYLGYADWRVPTIREIVGLVDASIQALPLGHPFTRIQTDYLPSTTYARVGAWIWVVNMPNGVLGSYGDKNTVISHVWPVRSAESSSVPAPTPNSGQTQSYTVGDDGSLRPGVAWPSPRFVDNSDGTVNDNLTGLTWLKNANCFSIQTWDNALVKANTLTSGACGLTDGSGSGDWHLPNKNELWSLVDYGRYNPALTAGTPFTSIPVNGSVDYWSSSSSGAANDNVMGVRMSEGAMFNLSKQYSTYLWPVRSRQFSSIGSLILSAAGTNSGFVLIGGRSASNQIRLRNSGVAPIAVNAIALTGTNPSQFSFAPGGTTPCANLTPTLSAGESCTLEVFSTPNARGEKTANLTFTTATGSQDIPLTATAYSTVLGTVTDMSTGLPVSGATVDLSIGSIATTDLNGRYDFGQQEGGTYNITVSKSGYQTVSKSGLVTTATSSAKADILLPTTGPLNITTTMLPSATAGEAYASRVMVAGGTAPYSIYKVYGNLPTGLSFNTATGSITGTPTGSGSFTFAIGVTDSAAGYSEREYTIHLVPPLKIITQTLPRGVADIVMDYPYLANISAEGGKPGYTFTLSSGSLPTCLHFDNGQLSGYTCDEGNYPIIVSVIDSTGRMTSKSFTIGVDLPLRIADAQIPTTLVNTSYSKAMDATGGHGAYTWSISTGNLPTGITLNPSTGILNGQTTSAGSFPVAITVMDAVGRTATKSFTLKISTPLAISTTSLPVGYVGSSYSQKVLTNGGISPFSFSYSGALPVGLALGASTGIISGTPSAAGLTNFSITVTDSSFPNPVTVTKALSLRIWSALSLTTSTIPTGSQSAVYSTTLNGSGGSQPLSWSIGSGALPAGVNLDFVTGTISGTPTNCGVFNFVVRLIDSAAVQKTIDKPLVLTVACPVNASCGAANDGVFSAPPSSSLCAAGTASTMIGIGPWSWTCNGEHGGTSASCSALRQWPLSLTLTGTGGGSVSGDISCISGAPCSPQAFLTGAKVTLLASPNSVSTFLGWSGDCAITGGNCLVTMDCEKAVTASFTKAPKAKIGVTGYDSLVAAYTSAVSPATILALDSEMPDTGLTMALGKTITIKGGHRADYSGKSGLPTLIKGVLRIRSGKLTVDSLVVK